MEESSKLRAGQRRPHVPPGALPPTPPRRLNDRRWRLGLVLVLVLVTVAVTAALGPPAPAAQSPSSPATGPAASPGTARLAAGSAYQVTLLTGDVVSLHGRKDGAPDVRIRPAARPSGDKPSFQITTSAQGTHVIPADVAPLVPGTLDPALFDVTSLVAQGYDDRHASGLPLLVRSSQPAARRGSLGALAAGEPAVGPALASIGAVAVRQPKKQTAKLLPALVQAAGAARAGGRAAASDLLGGVTRIQLDRKLVKPSALDRNLIQVNAQAAWDAGATGQGAKLAVLDTGVDATHPDLVGRVAAVEDFTGAGDPTDRLGHGTHVAGIAAGSGAAAAGERRGLAFDASLLVGKVCDDTGSCADSAIIAGMEWSAAQGAKVVNLSLSGPHTDGLDPIEEALERLTADCGMLFVVAAGNGGPRGDLPSESGTVGSPAEAPSALAVGAVDADGATAGFSSTGPAQGALSLKPEITAPGVDIIAPRASGSELGEPVGESYMKLSGTSMATPHVSGVAAALAQRFPDRSPAQLKAALVGTATPAPGTSVYDQGGGLLNAGRAATQTVVAETATVDFGRVTFPHPQPGHVLQRPVTLRNLGASELTLDLTATLTGPDGQPAPAGTLALSADRLTLPAGQTGSVQAILTEPQAMGLYSGQVTATAGQTRISLPVAVYNEHERVDLTLSLRDRTGAPATSLVYLLALDGPASLSATAVDGQRTLRLPPGRYHAVTGIYFDGDDPASGLALAVNPEIDATGTAPVTLTLDARQAVLAAPTIAGRQTANRGTEISAERYTANGGALGYSIADGWRDGSGGHSGRPVAITPTGRVTTGTFTGSTQALLEDTALPSPATDTDGTPLAPDAFHLLFVHQQQIPALLDYDLTAEDVASRMARARITTAATPAAAQDQDGQPGIDERWFGRHPALGLTVTFPLHVRGPVRRDHYLLTGQGITWQPLIEAALPDFDFLSLAGPVYTLRGGQRVQRTFFQQPLRPTVTTGTTMWGDPLAPVTRTPTELRLGQLPTAVDTAGNFESADFNWRFSLAVTTRLYQDGELIEERPFAGDTFPIAARRATHRLEVDTSDPTLAWSPTTRTSWQFTTAPPASGEQAVPLLTISYNLPTNLDHQIPAGTDVLQFHLARQPGAGTTRITDADVWLSTDDGETWTKTTTSLQPGGQLTARPDPAQPQPQPGDLVSLRVRGTDSDHNTVNQTIIRAYAIGPTNH